MSSTNKTTRGNDHRFSSTERLAGGAGLAAAKQSAIKQLRRATLACLLWENSAYEMGDSTVKNIQALIPQCDPNEVAALAVEIRTKQGIRHTPLLLLRELQRGNAEARRASRLAMPQVMLRADDMTEFLALYWKDGKCSLTWQVKKGLQEAFNRFNRYALKRYSGEGKAISLRDVMFMVHVKPKDLPRGATKWDKAARKAQGQTLSRQEPLTDGEQKLYEVTTNTLPAIETRETELSKSTTDDMKKDALEALLREGKMGTLALLRTLRKMEEVKIDRALVRKAIESANPDKILPLNFYGAFRNAAVYAESIEVLMKKSMATFTRLPGRSVIVVDVSGSMGARVSEKSEFTRMQAAAMLAVMAQSMCERSNIYATAGSDGTGVHKTRPIHGHTGWGLFNEIIRDPMGGGGIFTRQALEFIKTDLRDEAKSVDRIIVISDSQDCDRANKVPRPFGKKNYIIDISSHKNGINYDGVWTEEISGWSQSFLEYIAQGEALDSQV